MSLSHTTLTLSFPCRYNSQFASRVYGVIATNPTIDRITGKLSDQSLLFQYTIKLVLIVSFSELILYRLVSRLGMHLSKLAQEHEWIIPTFTALDADWAVAAQCRGDSAVSCPECGGHQSGDQSWVCGIE